MPQKAPEFAVHNKQRCSAALSQMHSNCIDATHTCLSTCGIAAAASSSSSGLQGVKAQTLLMYARANAKQSNTSAGSDRDIADAVGRTNETVMFFLMTNCYFILLRCAGVPILVN